MWKVKTNYMTKTVQKRVWRISRPSTLILKVHISIGSILRTVSCCLFSFRFASASDDNLAVIWDAKVFYFYFWIKLGLTFKLQDGWSVWNLEVFVFKEKGKLEYSAKNVSEYKGREPTTNSIHIWCRTWDFNSGLRYLEASALDCACAPLTPLPLTALL